MNDEDLKKIIKQDQSTPLVPANEWTLIEKKISSKQKRTWLEVPTIMAFACLLIIFVGNHLEQSKPISQEEIAQFIFVDEDVEELYTWVDI